MRPIDADHLLEQLSHAALSPASKMIVRMLIEDAPAIEAEPPEGGADNADM